jgi:hypothetical protein
MVNGWSRWCVTASAALVLGGAVASFGQSFTLNKCSAGKKKCVSARTAALLKCHVTSETKGVPPGEKDCITKAQTKYDGGVDPEKGCFAKLEAKYAPGSETPCLTFGDSAALAVKVDTFVVSAVSAVDPAYPDIVISKCSAGKKKCLSSKLVGLLKCHQKAESKGVSPNDKSCIDKAKAKFDGGLATEKGCFAKLEAKYTATSETPCPTFGDTATVEALVDAFVADVVSDLDPGVPTTTTIPPTTTTTGPGTTSTTTTAPTTTTVGPTTTTTTTTSVPTTTTTTTMPSGVACGPNGLIARIRVPYDPFALPALASIRLDVTYPTTVGIPGSGFETDDSRLTIVTGQSGSTIFVDRDNNNDGTDDTFRIAYALTGGLTFAPGDFADVLLDCTSGTPVSPAAFGCLVLDAANPVGTSVPNPQNIPCGVTSLRLP